LNRKRSLKPVRESSKEFLEEPVKTPEDLFHDGTSTLVTYLCFLIGFLERRSVARHDVIVLIKEVRQHCIAGFGFYSYIDRRYSGKSP